MQLTVAVLAAVLSAGSVSAQSGSGQTTRYWDCCKASCGWPGKGSLKKGPITSCDRNDSPLSDGGNTKSSCDNGGGAYMCSSQQPWAVNSTLAYGFAAAKLQGATESTWCCQCYELTFTQAPLSGKKMIVQISNTGGDLGANHFDLAIPGGGVGLFNACSNQWGAPSNGWGERYGGISSASACDSFPAKLQPGCKWRFDWFANADNPPVTFRPVQCPSELVAKSGCERN